MLEKSNMLANIITIAVILLFVSVLASIIAAIVTFLFVKVFYSATVDLQYLVPVFNW
jgi:capsular polysaccharide biosynthesis protein